MVMNLTVDSFTLLGHHVRYATSITDLQFVVQ